mgnify:CR=1 FL=1
MLLRGEKRNTLIGQACLPLTSNNAWLNGGVFVLPLEAIEVSKLFVVVTSCYLLFVVRIYINSCLF